MFGKKDAEQEKLQKKLEKEKLDADIARIIEASKPKDINKNIYDLETTKVIMEKVTSCKNLLSTTNVTRIERWENIKLVLAAHYSGNPVPLIISDSYLQLNRSLNGSNGPISVLEILGGIFMAASSVKEEGVGRWGRLKQFIGGR